jgi:hypothetical protein
MKIKIWKSSWIGFRAPWVIAVPRPDGQHQVFGCTKTWETAKHIALKIAPVLADDPRSALNQVALPFRLHSLLF